MSSTGIAASTANGAATGGSVGGPWGAIIGGAIGLGTGISSDQAGRDLEADAEKAVRQAVAQYNGVIPPEVRAIIVNSLQQQGLYTPKMEEALNLGPSQVSNIQEDSGVKDAQMQALQQLGQVSQTGLRPEDRLAMIGNNNATTRDARANQGALLQQLRAQGMSGPEAEAIVRAQGSQQGTNAAAEQADANNSMAAQNALSALSQYQDLSGNTRNQDFQVQNSKAQAADEFNRFNVQAKQAAANTNTNEQNKAQASNLAESQRISNTNNDNTYNEATRQQQAQQQRYQNQMAVASAKANALNGQSNLLNQQGQQNAQGTANAVAGGLGALGSLGSLLAKNNNGGQSVAAAPASANTVSAFDGQGQA